MFVAKLLMISLMMLCPIPKEKEMFTCTVLYDNYIFEPGTKADWGFACLLEGGEKKILFDTGTKPDILWHNIDKLGVDVSDLDEIIISHDHGDHTGGLVSVLDKTSDVTIYLPASFTQSSIERYQKLGARVELVSDPLKLERGIYLSGEMGTRIKEQSLFLETKKGVVIVTGCSHQGIVSIIEKAREVVATDIYLVFGGFHLMEHSESAVNNIIERFRELGVEKCGATHCTGDAQIAQFKEAFAEDYVQMGVGRILEIER